MIKTSPFRTREAELASPKLYNLVACVKLSIIRSSSRAKNLITIPILRFYKLTDEEEKVIEVNVDLGRPFVTLILIILVIAQAGYIGYITQGSRSSIENTDLVEGLEEEVSEPEGPEWYVELKADIFEAGCDVIIEEWDYWQGKHLDVGYEEMLEYAGKSKFVGIYRNMEAVYIFTNGTGYIWFIP